MTNRRPLHRFRLSVRALMALVLAVSLGIFSLKYASDLLAGLLLLLTLGTMATVALAVVYRRGAVRASLLGFLVFGSGYMALTCPVWGDPSAYRPALATSIVLEHLAPYFQPRVDTPTSSSLFSQLLAIGDPRSVQIQAKLEAPLSMPFNNETPLEDVIKYIKNATVSPQLPDGIPIYVDPTAMQAVEKTMTSPVTLNLEGVPLKTTLYLMLQQLGLRYTVTDGLLVITNATAPSTTDSFRRIGQCWWALAVACAGAIAGRAVFAAPGRDVVG